MRELFLQVFLDFWAGGCPKFSSVNGLELVQSDAPIVLGEQVAKLLNEERGGIQDRLGNALGRGEGQNVVKAGLAGYQTLLKNDRFKLSKRGMIAYFFACNFLHIFDHVQPPPPPPPGGGESLDSVILPIIIYSFYWGKSTPDAPPPPLWKGRDKGGKRGERRKHKGKKMSLYSSLQICRQG